jgi:hypothetical protein
MSILLKLKGQEQTLTGTTQTVVPDINPYGREKSWETTLLEYGSKIFQAHRPLKGTDIYLMAFHPMKENPCHQMDAHHYCKQVNEDFAQCVLYDSNRDDANLIGIEYIISETLFRKLPYEERKYWHPHNYEIISGYLVAPGLPEVAEKAFLKSKLNSYGKTIHTWRAKCWEGDQRFIDKLPYGPPIIGWSFNYDGEIKPEMQMKRDELMGISTQEKRDQRKDLVSYCHPQSGVNDLKQKYSPEKQGNLTALAGVLDIKDVDGRNSMKAQEIIAQGKAGADRR